MQRYQTVEGNLNDAGDSAVSAEEWAGFHNEAMEAFNQIKPLQQLWSPNCTFLAALHPDFAPQF